MSLLSQRGVISAFPWLLACLLLACEKVPDQQNSIEYARAPEATQAELADKTMAHAIVDVSSGQLFGASTPEGWLLSDDAAQLLTGGEVYRLYAPSRDLGEASGSAALPPEEICTNWFVQISDQYTEKDNVLAVQASWDALPRLSQSQSLKQISYLNAIGSYLRVRDSANGDAKLKQVLRLDLEGDGVEEVLISATNLNERDAGAPKGGYSLIALRKIIDEKVQTIVIDESFYPEGCDFCSPVVHTVVGVYDLNGDGNTEIVVASESYEGEGKEIFEVHENKIDRVLAWSCGA